MKEIETMTAEQLANHILSQVIKKGETVEFAIAQDPHCNEKPQTVEEILGWFFIKMIEIPEYCSKFILIDYCGGQEATVYPIDHSFNGINAQNADFDEEDFKNWIQAWFSDFCEEKHGAGPDKDNKGQYIVYVDIRRK